MEPKGFVRDVVLLLVTMLVSGVAILYLRASSPNTRWADSSASWEPRVNALDLNLELDAVRPKR